MRQKKIMYLLLIVDNNLLLHQVSEWEDVIPVFRLLKKHLKIDNYIYVCCAHRGQSLECASTEVVKMCHWCQRFPEFLTTLFNNWNKICSIVSSLADAS